MLFNSLSFFIFFPVVVSIYFFLPHRFRAYFLLAASSYFYMAFVPKYILVLLFLISIDFFLAKLIEKTSGSRRKIYLIISIVANVGTLFTFKYLVFFNQNLAVLAKIIHWNYTARALNLALPIGLSFHVFQSLSYVIEVFRKKHPAEKNFFIYALYVMFFPQLVAGPIERPQHLLPQLHQEHSFEYQRVTDGLKMMFRGMFKKIVIADRLALFTVPIFNHPSGYEGPALLIGMLFFAFQIYGDFSGYSDIAVGAAQVMGFDLTRNFNRPYLAKTITEFWRRWHITLSSWLRDYIFLPLAIRKRHWGKIGLVYAAFLTFVAVGLWHGANWTFVIFGLIHGMAISWEILLQKSFHTSFKYINFRFLKFLGVAYTFIFWSYSLVFFRAANVSDGWFIVKETLRHPVSGGWRQAVSGPGQSPSQLIIVVISILLLVTLQIIQERRGDIITIINTLPGWVRWSFYYAALFAMVGFGVIGSVPFIYFQF